MKKVLAFCAIAMFVMPALGASETFKATIDGSFNIYHSGGGNEGYGNAGTSSTFRLDKSHQHMGFLDWDGAVGSGGGTMADFVAANPSFEAYLWVKSVSGIGNKSGIVTIRTSNVGNIVEDGGISATDYSAAAGVEGTSGAVAFRMADLSSPPTGYINDGEGIDMYGDAAYAGQAWKRPSTGLAAGSRSGSYTFKPGDEVYNLGTSSPRLGFWDGELWGVEGVVGFHWSQASNDVTRFTNAGQLVNTDDAGTGFRWLDSTCAQADGWYKVKLTNAIVLDMINNVENKGIIVSSWVAGGTVNWGAPAYGNDSVYSKDHQGGVFAPYIELTPEPGTIMLLALGGLALIRRRR